MRRHVLTGCDAYDLDAHNSNGCKNVSILTCTAECSPSPDITAGSAIWHAFVQQQLSCKCILTFVALLLCLLRMRCHVWVAVPTLMLGNMYS